MSLQDIVNVSITRNTKAVSRAGFSTMNILGVNKAFTERIRFYSNMDAVLLDFNSVDKEAVAASDAFAQSPTVTRLAISRRLTGDITVITVATIANNTVYSVTINGTVFSITSDSDATKEEIAADLCTAINAGSEPVTATDQLDGTFELEADVASTFYSVINTANLTAAFTTSVTPSVDIAAIREANDNWYALVYTERTQADVEAISEYIETVTKIFLTASSEAAIIGTTDSADTTTIAAVLKALSYARSGVFYHSLAATQYPEAALLGVILPLDPGSYTGAFNTLSSITVDTLTETQIINALAKNVNIYIETGDVNITREGTVAEGEYIDIIIFIDWVIARITEAIFSILVNLPKVAYDDGGITAVDGEVTGVLELGVERKGIAEDPAFSVTVPLAADVSAGDKAARTLNNVTFDFTLTGAIHAVTVRGTAQV